MPILKQSSALPAISSIKSSGRLQTRFATASASSCGEMDEDGKINKIYSVDETKNV
jgi:hypothetical protein